VSDSSNVKSSEKTGSAGRYLCFSLDQKKFAIPLLDVKEVIGNIGTTTIPQAPEYFKGIINLRGQMISIIDLKAKLKIGKGAANSESTIIILDLPPLSIGVIVDSADCVAAYTEGDLNHTPDLDPAIQADFITGVASKDSSLTLILDLKAALNAEDYKTMANARESKAAA
jgi:purine-binding chemotaxis protein CheW